jgi:thymidylate synthase (methanogen type)
MEIVADTIAEAHEKVVKAIIESGPGIDIETSPGKWEKTWEYPEQIQIIVRHPDRQPQRSSALAFGELSCQEYRKELVCITPPKEEGFQYTYANRLFDYPVRDADMVSFGGGPCPVVKVRGNGKGDGFNQIHRGVLDRLIGNQESRRALAITWVPEEDALAVKDQPCLQFVHFLIRNGQIDDGNDPEKKYLHMRAPFRSHDMNGGYGPNAIALEGLMEYVRDEYVNATGISVEIGTLTTTSSSAHLYWKRDASDLQAFKKVLGIS